MDSINNRDVMDDFDRTDEFDFSDDDFDLLPTNSEDEDVGHGRRRSR